MNINFNDGSNKYHINAEINSAPIYRKTRHFSSIFLNPSFVYFCSKAKLNITILYNVKERVSKENGSDPSELPCPTCKTAPFIG